MIFIQFGIQINEIVCIFQKYRAINDEIRRFYFGNGVINMDKSPQYIDLLSDMNFGYAIEKMAKLHAVKAKGKSFYVRLVFLKWQ